MTWWEIFIQDIGGVHFATLWTACLCLLLLGLRELISLCKGIVTLKKRAKAKKRARIQAARQLQYTLPDARNDYLRERLRTTLHADGYLGQKGKAGMPVRLRYAEQMLSLLKASALSPVERLEVEEMGKVVALYQEEEDWGGEEIKAVNEIFSRLLKLSAKYEIAV